ncbi:Uncharacterised protein (plasmid) [Tsukamurella tyrosinosolvens]|uniref:Uncharacterized protein n=1 Tax=Tsukamurella tyrosinosolvens TaxID=57704 RepID=A0A1H4PQR7_TSUTY|nr:hypothetical protein [Tsukamurella tyrosinosolvens]AUN39700.1 hypothetical protein ASU32_06455 [Tsukamurella tyrosinosolvens]KXO97427.1 hypothetical protein AXK58_09450 [Tsukamurella tyrosinosolvens]MEC4616097.1 hypothetical protein [Tsukamurella tyrosinosolvens]QRY86464.1 hypothetical protein JVY00_10680 [Tsukamurella tyrosinosolvens]RDB48190.1 hypothetical protein DVB87_09260 [Tsukamurella tyrosinosolvens]
MEPLDRILLGVATVGGAVCGVGAAMYLYLYSGAVPLPLSAVLFGALLAAISVAARRLGGEPVHGALPVIAFLLVIAAFLAGGPGGDIVLYVDWRLLLLLLCGIGMPILAGHLASSEK